MHFQCIVLSCFSTLHDESIDVFHYGDLPLSRELGEIWKLVLVGHRQLIISSWIQSSIHQQSWMPSQSADHQLMLLMALVELSARLPMLAGHLGWSSAEQPMWSVQLAEGID